ncbi:cation efflux protein [Phycomyces nitens]|nr:cation efflux protein [Phycomyces nitens]
MWLWSAGTSQESLAAVGFSYLLMFDALGVLNSFASSIIHTHPAYSVSTTKRPFGARRQEIVFALGTIIFLLFVTMYNTKEALEHFLLEGSHDGGHGSQTASHHRMSFGLFTLVCLGLMASFVSSVGLRNHDHFVRFLRRAPPTVHGFSYNVINRGRDNPIHALVNNVYSLSIVASGITILLFSVLGLVTPSMDKVLALGESGVMLYLGYPTAVALAKVLLQMTPDGVRQGVDNRLAEIRLDPRVIAIDRVHFWQNTYGKYVGTLEVQIRPEADESSVLWMVYEKLEGFTSEGNQKSELTVSIIKL